MAENEEDFLPRCPKENICPVCHQAIIKKFGSGQFKDGVFLFVELLRRMEQSIADKTTSRQGKKSKSDE